MNSSPKKPSPMTATITAYLASCKRGEEAVDRVIAAAAAAAAAEGADRQEAHLADPRKVRLGLQVLVSQLFGEPATLNFPSSSLHPSP